MNCCCEFMIGWHRNGAPPPPPLPPPPPPPPPPSTSRYRGRKIAQRERRVAFGWRGRRVTAPLELRGGFDGAQSQEGSGRTGRLGKLLGDGTHRRLELSPCYHHLHEEVLLVVGTPVVDHMEVGGFAAPRAAVLNEGRHGVLPGDPLGACHRTSVA